MARSRRRFGAKMPGVSMNTICAAPSVTTPRIWARVVCALWVTIDTLVPTSALSSVDLPALGAPTSATKPQRVALAAHRRCDLGFVARSCASLQTFSRTRNASAALCSASFLEGPVAVSGSKPASRTSMVNSGRGRARCARLRRSPAVRGRGPAPIPAASSWRRRGRLPRCPCCSPNKPSMSS